MAWKITGIQYIILLQILSLLKVMRYSKFLQFYVDRCFCESLSKMLFLHPFMSLAH